MASTPPLPLTYTGINFWVSQAKADLAVQQQSERTELNERHSNEKKALQDQWSVSMAAYRAAKAGMSMDEQLADDIGNKTRLRMATVVVRVRRQFGINGSTVSEVVSALRQRLAALVEIYRAHGNDRKELAKVEKKERDYRNALIDLGESDESLPEWVVTQAGRGQTKPAMLDIPADLDAAIDDPEFKG